MDLTQHDMTFRHGPVSQTHFATGCLTTLYIHIHTSRVIALFACGRITHFLSLSPAGDHPGPLSSRTMQMPYCAVPGQTHLEK
eukprot:533417-Hanusia_phi.AAC.1